jgi:hypothetical protein
MAWMRPSGTQATEEIPWMSSNVFVDFNINDMRCSANLSAA